MGGCGGHLRSSYEHPIGMAAYPLRDMAAPTSGIQLGLQLRSINLPFQNPDTAPQIVDHGPQSSLKNFAPCALATSDDEGISPGSVFECLPVVCGAGVYLPDMVPIDKEIRGGGNGAGWNSDGTYEEWANFDLTNFSNAVLHNETTFGQGNETLGFGDIGEMEMAALPDYFNMWVYRPMPMRGMNLRNLSGHQSMTGWEEIETLVPETDILE